MAENQQQMYGGVLQLDQIMNNINGQQTSEAGQAAQLAAQGNVLNTALAGQNAQMLAQQQQANSLEMMGATVAAQGMSNMAQNQHTAGLNMDMLGLQTQLGMGTAAQSHEHKMANDALNGQISNANSQIGANAQIAAAQAAAGAQAAGSSSSSGSSNQSRRYFRCRQR